MTDLYYCHVCSDEWNAHEPSNCRNCGSDFIEQIENEMDDPRAFVREEDPGDEDDFDASQPPPTARAQGEAGFNFIGELLQRMVGGPLSPQQGQPGQHSQDQPAQGEVGEGGARPGMPHGHSVTFTYGNDQGLHVSTQGVQVENLAAFINRAFTQMPQVYSPGAEPGGQNQAGGQNDWNQVFGRMFGVQGNMGDYVWSQRALDDIVSRLMEQHGSQAPPPASQEAVDQLASITVGQDLVEQKWDCPVCKEDLVEGERVLQLPACKHIYHPDCIKKWLATSNSCPICRAPVALQDTPPTAQPPANPNQAGPPPRQDSGPTADESLD